MRNHRHAAPGAATFIGCRSTGRRVAIVLTRYLRKPAVPKRCNKYSQLLYGYLPTDKFEKLRRALYGRRSERSERLLRQLELELDELTASATEDDLRAETGPDRTTGGKGFERHRPSRKPFPEHLSRERVVVPAPTSCTCCGSRRLSKVGEDVTETLEVIPRQWKVIETVREKFTCRDCEKFSQPPAPFHAVPRGWAGPNLLATIVFEKYGQHQPLNRQSERYAREGVEAQHLDADRPGGRVRRGVALHELIAAHVLAAQRVHGDDTPVPVLAKGKTDTARAWAYVRDDAPFANQDPPAALFRYSRNRSGAHPVEHLRGFAGNLSGRRPCRIQPALCAGPGAGAGLRSFLLGPRAAEILRTRRHRGQQEARQERDADRSADAGGGETHFRARAQAAPCGSRSRRRARTLPRCSKPEYWNAKAM